jgi:hypothetical protein
MPFTLKVCVCISFSGLDPAALTIANADPSA